MAGKARPSVKSATRAALTRLARTEFDEHAERVANLKPAGLRFVDLTGNEAPMIERKAIGYFRMSSKSGALMRSDLESQREALRGHAAAERLRVVGECVDYENGKRAERTQFAKALAACAECGGVLVIPRLGPLARDPTFYIQLHVANVDFVVLDMPGITRASLLTMGQAAHRADARRKALAS